MKKTRIKQIGRVRNYSLRQKVRFDGPCVASMRSIPFNKTTHLYAKITKATYGQGVNRFSVINLAPLGALYGRALWQFTLERSRTKPQPLPHEAWQRVKLETKD